LGSKGARWGGGKKGKLGKDLVKRLERDGRLNRAEGERETGVILREWRRKNPGKRESKPSRRGQAGKKEQGAGGGRKQLTVLSNLRKIKGNCV